MRRKTKLKPVKLCLKIDLVLHSAYVVGLLIYQYIKHDCGIMAIVIRNELSYQSSNPDLDRLHFSYNFPRRY